MSWLTAFLRLAFVAAEIAACTDLFAEDAPQPGERPAVSPLRRLMDESLREYELKSSPSDQPMTARVAMRWANNTRGSEGGMTVLYLADGIPQAVCSIYPWEQQLFHEFDSVSRSKLLCQFNGINAWTPATAGVEFRAIPNAEVPADSAVNRLRQMKSLSSHFTSTMLGWRSDKSDRETLRLLTQPLYRYESLPMSNRFDGAVFAFVQGTDPESLLLIEAVRHEGVARWEYAFVRQTSGELEGRYRDQVVWQADRFPVSNQPQSVHFTQGVPLPVDVRESLKRNE